MNNVMLIGRLTKDPEMRYFSDSGSAQCTFTLAVDRQISKEKKQEMINKGQDTADFIRIVFWGKQAELCNNYLSKGKMVAVQGRIQTGSYTNQQGQRVYTTDVVGERVQFLSPMERSQGESYSSNNPYQGSKQGSNQGSDHSSAQNYFNQDRGGFDDDNDDFIPFNDDMKIPF